MVTTLFGNNLRRVIFLLMVGVFVSMGGALSALAAPPVNDMCENALVVNPGAGGVQIFNTDATRSPDDSDLSCTMGPGFGSVFFEFMVTDTDVQVRTDLESIGLDSDFAVYAVDQFSPCDKSLWTEVGCSEDGEFEFNGSICVEGLVIGDTYKIMLMSFTAGSSGEYTLQIDSPCPGGPDEDDDGDGVSNALDQCPGFDDAVDSDSDRVPDGCDICLGFDDAVDSDADGIPDGCDPDDDNDGTPDDSDAFPFDPTETADSDSDGIGDNADACPNDPANDADSDGVCGDVDLCPATPASEPVDADGCSAAQLFQPSVDIDKTGDSLSKVGDTVNYTITVTNTSSGDSPNLTCTITDALLGINKNVNLAPGDVDVTNAARIVDALDPDPLPNTADVTCTVDGFGNVVNASDGHVVELFQPSVGIEKTADVTESSVGETVNYTITLSNTSSADSPALTCTITDTLLGINKNVNLASGSVDVTVAARVVDSLDPDPLLNTADATCTVDGFGNTLNATDSHSIDLGCEANPLSQGYWHRQCLGVPAAEGGIDPGRNGRGPQEPLEPEFVKRLMDPVGELLQQRIFEFGGACAAGMNADPASDPCEQAVKQYTAMLFNLGAGRLQGFCDIDVSADGCTSTTVTGLVGELSALIQSGDSDSCMLAARCAAAVNEGDALVESAVLTAELPDTQQAGSDGPVFESTRAPAASGRDVSQPEEAVASEPAETPFTPAPLVGVALTAPKTEVAEAEVETEAPVTTEDNLQTLRRHLAVLVNASAPESAVEVSTDALLTALSGGYELETRIEIVQGLFLRIDDSLVSLLVEHLRDIRDEARDFDREELVNEAERLLKRLEVPEK